MWSSKCGISASGISWKEYTNFQIWSQKGKGRRSSHNGSRRIRRRWRWGGWVGVPGWEWYLSAVQILWVMAVEVNWPARSGRHRWVSLGVVVLSLDFLIFRWKTSMLNGDEDDDAAYDYFPPVCSKTGGKSQRFTILGGKNSISHPCVSKMCLKGVKRKTNVTFMTHPTGQRTHQSSSTQWRQDTGFLYVCKHTRFNRLTNSCIRSQLRIILTVYNSVPSYSLHVLIHLFNNILNETEGEKFLFYSYETD